MAPDGVHVVEIAEQLGAAARELKGKADEDNV